MFGIGKSLLAWPSRFLDTDGGVVANTSAGVQAYCRARIHRLRSRLVALHAGKVGSAYRVASLLFNGLLLSFI